MKKLLLLLLFLSPLSSMASVDESKMDMYFANGVDTSRKQAKEALNNVLKPTITKEIYNNDITKRDQAIGKFDLLYNNTDGLLSDLSEAILQKISTGNDFMDVFRSYFFGLFSSQVTAIIFK